MIVWHIAHKKMRRQISAAVLYVAPTVSLFTVILSSRAKQWSPGNQQVRDSIDDFLLLARHHSWYHYHNTDLEWYL